MEAQTRAPDGYHPSELGHAYVADVASFFLYRVATMHHPAHAHHGQSEPAALPPAAAGSAPGVVIEQSQQPPPPAAALAAAEGQALHARRQLLQQMDVHQIAHVLWAPERLPPLVPGLPAVPPSTWVCAYSHRLTKQPSLTFQHGPGWVYDADDHTHSKCGFITNATLAATAAAATNATTGTAPAATQPPLTVVFTPPAGSWRAANHTGRVLSVIIGYLESYGGVMGRARMACSAGCQCSPVEVDASTSQKTSLTQLALLHIHNAGSWEACSISVTPLPPAGSDGSAGSGGGAGGGGVGSGSKFKVTGVLCVEGEGEQESAMLWST